jgi:ferric-dicitrate binding protein FerR (iron transport regulator)
VNITTQHILAYLDKELSTEERYDFEKTLESSAELRQELEEIRLAWEMTAELKMHKRINTAKNWKELSRRITVEKFRRKLWIFTRNTAAIFLLPFMIAALLLFKGVKERDHAPAEQIELTSANGLVSKVSLSDGSEVWLNSGSKLSYPQRFKEGIREVSLSGEAYFKVKADDENRFVVLAGEKLSVSAYGTEFNICAYEDEQTIEATLVAGNIEVSVVADEKSGKTKILREQQAVFDKESGKLTAGRINVAVETSWKDGKMLFRRANMKEITRCLSHHFNVDIYLQGEELHDYEYSATFTTETLEEILYLLEKSSPIKIEIIYPEQADNYSYTKRSVVISIKE